MIEENESGPGAEPTAEQLTVSEAMSGVFTSPGDTFETIAATPRKNYWITPVLISAVVGLLATFLFMRDTELVESTFEKQREKLQAQFDENVKEGKMTQEDADKALEGMSPDSMFVKIAGYGGALIGPFLILFILSVVYMLILKIAKAEFDFFNILNVVGLSLLIGSIGTLLATVASIFMGKLTSVGLGLPFSEESVGSKTYALLSKIDVFNIWFYIVIAIGLSKIAKVSFGLAAAIVFGIFIIYSIVSSFVF